MKPLYLPTKPRREIDADELEKLFAKGLRQKEVARKMKIDETLLSKRINESFKLYNARRRGQMRAKK